MKQKTKNDDIVALMDFLNTSPTAWHAVDNVKEILIDAGFTELFEKETWKIKPGSKYFVIRNGSSLCAFIAPKKAPQVVNVVASHTDSPGFKLKPNPEFRRENMIMLGVEIYGAPLITSWLNRDLGIAGRIAYTDSKGNIKESLVRLDESPVVIPQLAIHLDRQVNDSGLLLHKQEHLAAIAALVPDREAKFSFLQHHLRDKISFQDLLGFDLFLFPLEPAATIGYQQQMIASYSIDNLCSLHASVRAICDDNSADNHTLKMIVMWDNEEIGSETVHGAASPFLSHTLERITLNFGMTREEYLCLMQNSLCVSVDLGHAFHPNYPERYEPQHRLLMQHGVVIKYSSQHRYASDARSTAQIINLCKKHRIPFQNFVTRGDIPAGTTIGPIHAHKTGMPTVDIGCAQLSMHSCREIISCQDYRNMHTLLYAFFRQKAS